LDFEIVFFEGKKKVFEKKGFMEAKKILEECNDFLKK
jgi:hypothetical protein